MFSFSWSCNMVKMRKQENLLMKGGLLMSSKKKKASDVDKKAKPDITNDQLGENSGEGRFEKAINSKSGKCR